MRSPLRTLPLIVLPLAACASDARDATGVREPVPGTLVVTLVTPHADDRAIVVRVTGPRGAAGVAAANAAYVVHARDAADGFRAAAFGDLAGGALLTFAVPDVARRAEYAATVLEASDASDAPRADLSGYRLTVSRP